MKLDDPFSNPGFPREDASSNPESMDIFAALLRYRWVVIIPTVIGLIIGFVVHSRLPEGFRSSAKLMVESDRPQVLDQVTGDVYGGVPGIDVVRELLYSDTVLAKAFDSPRLEPFRSHFGDNSANFIASARSNLALVPEVKDKRSTGTLIASLSYEHENAELCEAAVESFSDVFRNFFNDADKEDRSDLIRLISTAMDDLLPQMTKLEEAYREFRVSAPLEWNARGVAINPHRERQLFLTTKRSELIESYRQSKTELAAIKRLAANSSRDPLLALNVIGQLLDKQFELPTQQKATVAVQKDSDIDLGQLDVDERLVPLMIEANTYAAEYGENHPTVKALRAQLSTMQGELRRLVRERSDRVLQLIAEAKAEEAREKTDPLARAREAVNAVLLALQSQIGLMEMQIKELDQQIAEEKDEASKMAWFEQENIAHLRGLEQTRGLLSQLEDQMARVTLLKDEGGTKVIELKAPSKAIPVVTSLLKMLFTSGFIGLAIGAGFALLLEKNANTFRDPDEVSGFLGVPVLTHVPFFRGKVRRVKKGEINPHESLDPHMVVVHSPSCVAAEAVRSCRTSLFFETGGGDVGSVIQVTSPLPGDGKSTIAGNLACSIAQSGKRVLAVDCDLRRPQLTTNFSQADGLGLTNVLNGDCEPSDASHQTSLKNLWVMPSGPVPTNPAEALTLPDMAELLDLLRQQYDYVILDTPPLLVVTDPSITASMADAVVMALRIRRKSKPNARESVNILRSVGANLLGIVINNSDEASASDGYRGYGYYRYGRYTQRYERRGGESGKSIDANAPMMVSGRPDSLLGDGRSRSKSVSAQGAELPSQQSVSDTQQV